MKNGQAFVLTVWDFQNCRIFDSSEDETLNKWSAGWTLLNYLTHKVGISKSFQQKLDFYARIDEM